MLLECCVNVIKSLSFNKLKLMLRAPAHHTHRTSCAYYACVCICIYASLASTIVPPVPVNQQAYELYHHGHHPQDEQPGYQLTNYYSYLLSTHQFNSDLIIHVSTVPYFWYTFLRYVSAVVNSFTLRGFMYATNASSMASNSVFTLIVDGLVTNHRTTGHSYALCRPSVFGVWSPPIPISPGL